MIVYNEEKPTKNSRFFVVYAQKIQNIIVYIYAMCRLYVDFVIKSTNVGLG
jgi:hypothetical protein